MDILYFEPAQSAWRRMVAILFQPFRLEKWLVIGFAAWLAGLASGGQGGFGWTFPGDRNGDDSASIAVAVDDFVHASMERHPQVEVFEHLRSFEPWVLGCVAILLAVVLAVLVVCLWLSSRGAFIFLDDVVHDRAVIVEPWKRYARLGNSLFFWRLGLVAVVLVAVGLWVAAFIFWFPRWWLLVPAIAALVLFAFGIALVDLLLRHFVVPVMLRHDLTTNAAWRRLLPTLRSKPFHFLLYALMLVAIWIVVCVAILVAGLLTCCIGFLLLMIPYVGTVLLLPVLVFVRFFGLEFLRQFGPDLDLLEIPSGEASGV